MVGGEKQVFSSGLTDRGCSSEVDWLGWGWGGGGVGDGVLQFFVAVTHSHSSRRSGW